jgi:signal transduction histidine kinase
VPRADDAQRLQLVERERAARALHDTLLQGMQGLILRFQAVAERLPAGDPVRAQLDAALQRADKVLADSRDRVLHLHAAPAQGDALLQRLAHAGRELEGDYGAEFRLQVDGSPRALAEAVHEEVRLILGEALLNAFRHARAQRVVLRLSYRARGFSADVVDDGIGIDRALWRAGRTGHWGLSGMRERAECIGARLQLRRPVAGGSVIELRLQAGLAYAPA